MKKPTKQPTTRLGRPPAGIDGSAVRDYRRVTIYLPPEAADALERLAADTGLPRWRVVNDALHAHAKRTRR